ncbi:hypothetical protein DPMN_141653 [Dreissena polymorpha]|uniref:Uncharacterized protein n=1 Tax=Dreissena polymorpha TaxID=45954 RepID=A0A9D4JHW5_DREPO|nr:hypothetical protein DPMN_141653 [Dreissena polymorpha]
MVELAARQLRIPRSDSTLRLKLIKHLSDASRDHVLTFCRFNEAISIGTKPSELQERRGIVNNAVIGTSISGLVGGVLGVVGLALIPCKANQLTAEMRETLEKRFYVGASAATAAAVILAPDSWQKRFMARQQFTSRYTINVANVVQTSKIPLLGHQNIISTNVQTKKTAIPFSRVFLPTTSIFDNGRDILRTHVLTNVHEGLTLTVSTRVSARFHDQHISSHVFSTNRNYLKFEISRDIIRTNVLAKFHPPRPLVDMLFVLLPTFSKCIKTLSQQNNVLPKFHEIYYKCYI